MDFGGEVVVIVVAVAVVKRALSPELGFYSVNTCWRDECLISEAAVSERFRFESQAGCLITTTPNSPEIERVRREAANNTNRLALLEHGRSHEEHKCR